MDKTPGGPSDSYKYTIIATYARAREALHYCTFSGFQFSLLMVMVFNATFNSISVIYNDITDILLKVTLNSINQPTQL